jgi:hypothetical protein
MITTHYEISSRNTYGVAIVGEWSNAINDCGLFVTGTDRTPTFTGDCALALRLLRCLPVHNVRFSSNMLSSEPPGAVHPSLQIYPRLMSLNSNTNTYVASLLSLILTRLSQSLSTAFYKQMYDENMTIDKESNDPRNQELFSCVVHLGLGSFYQVRHRE